MLLNPGEAVVAFIRRNEIGSDTYFAAIRRSESSFNQATNDFIFGPIQIPIREGGEHKDFETALQSILNAIKH